MDGYSAPEDSDSSDEDTTAAKGRKKVKKDPNAPKRATTSFMFFSNAVRSKMKEQNPGATFGEMVSYKRRCFHRRRHGPTVLCEGSAT